MDTKQNRRTFLGKTTKIGTVIAAASAPSLHAAEKNSDFFDTIRVGCLNVGSYSHSNIWAAFINPNKNAKGLPLTNIRITHCWDIEPERASTFAKNYDCKPVKNFYDMVGKVDGIINCGYYNHPWNHILHEPYFDAGLPNLVNRPFTNSLLKAKKIIDMAKQHDAPLLVPSALEHNSTIEKAKKWVTGKKILCYSAANSVSDYPTHGIHGLYMCCKAIAEAGNPVVSVAYKAKEWYNTPGLVILEHSDSEGNTFYGTNHHVGVKLESLETLLIHTPESLDGKLFNVHMATESPYNHTEFWAPTIWAFQKMALYGEMPQTFEQIYHKTAVFLAGWKSILENNGKSVRIDDVPEDWESPVALPNNPNVNTVELFKKKFG